jgi:hypothetical protein
MPKTEQALTRCQAELLGLLPCLSGSPNPKPPLVESVLEGKSAGGGGVELVRLKTKMEDPVILIIRNYLYIKK